MGNTLCGVDTDDLFAYQTLKVNNSFHSPLFIYFLVY